MYLMHFSLDIFAKGCISEGRTGLQTHQTNEGPGFGWLLQTSTSLLPWKWLQDHLKTTRDMVLDLARKIQSNQQYKIQIQGKYKPLDIGWFEMLMNGNGPTHGFPVRPHPCCPLVDCCSPSRRKSSRQDARSCWPGVGFLSITVPFFEVVLSLSGCHWRCIAPQRILLSVVGDDNIFQGCVREARGALAVVLLQ